jgi:hypothetical protein
MDLMDLVADPTAEAEIHVEDLALHVTPRCLSEGEGKRRNCSAVPSIHIAVFGLLLSMHLALPGCLSVKWS